MIVNMFNKRLFIVKTLTIYSYEEKLLKAKIISYTYMYSRVIKNRIP